MIIIHGKPPVYEEAQRIFKFPDTQPLAFAWGDKVYVVNNFPMTPDVKVHEETHLRQQKGDPATWWSKYLTDPKFRVDQEIEAYRNQYQYICASVADKNKRYKHLHNIATILSSPLYGKEISYTDAIFHLKKS